MEENKVSVGKGQNPTHTCTYTHTWQSKIKPAAKLCLHPRIWPIWKVSSYEKDSLFSSCRTLSLKCLGELKDCLFSNSQKYSDKRISQSPVLSRPQSDRLSCLCKEVRWDHFLEILRPLQLNQLYKMGGGKCTVICQRLHHSF